LPLVHAFQGAPLGSESIHRRLGRLLQDWCKTKNPFTGVTQPFFSPPPMQVLEDITVSLCFVEPKLSSPRKGPPPLPWPKPKDSTETVEQPAEQTAQQPKEQRSAEPGAPSPQEKGQEPPKGGAARYALSADSVVEIDSNVRSQAANVLFEGDDEGTSIASLLLDSLNKCAPDTRAELCANMLLTGGGSLLPGFKSRFRREVVQKIEQEEAYSSLRGLKNSFGFVDSMFPANYLGWLGGSVVGSLESVLSVAVTKENYNKLRSGE
jgi:hypothetical protein